jgi:arylsulfatase A-like enzyme/dienelactone hydrolase
MHTKLPFILLCALCGFAQAARPNILLIVGDDIGYGDLSSYGCKEIATPNLDAIAAGGTRFTSGYVTAPVCGPSRAGMLSGRHPSKILPYAGNPKHGSDTGLPKEHRLISDHLHAAGYRTAALGKWHLGESAGFEPQARGFDSFYGFLGGMHDYFNAEDKQWGPIMRDRGKGELKDYLTFALADEAAAIIAQKSDKPFFIYLAFNASHTPLQVPEEYLKKTAHITDPMRQKNMAMTLALDDAVGRVMKSLRDSGREEDTLVIFVSDNGAALIKGSAENGGSNAPLRGSKIQCWEGGVRVPFFVQWKSRLPASRVSDEPVSTLDLMPTLLAVSGIAAPAEQKMDGINLLTWLEGKAEFPKREPLFWKMGDTNLAIRDGDMKFVRVGKQQGLFNVRTDPCETKDLSARRPIITRQLQAKWKEWDASAAGASTPGGKQTGTGAANPKRAGNAAARSTWTGARPEILEYKRAGDAALTLHVFKPGDWTAADQRPALVLFHGGSWKVGEPAAFYPQCEYFAHRGLVAVSAEYRLGTKHGTTPRECVEDGKSALRWVREHAARLGIDPAKIIAGGGSAGGHVAAAATIIEGFNTPGEDAPVPIDPKALILFNPVLDTSEDGFGFEWVKDFWKDISPAEHIRPGLPPMLVQFGDKDPIYTRGTIERFRQRMEAAGNRCELKIHPGHGHGFFNLNRSKEAYRLTLSEADRFLATLGYLDGPADAAFMQWQCDRP